MSHGQHRTMDDYVREIVDRAPPLTAAQRDRIAVLLRPAVSTTDRPAPGRSPAGTVERPAESCPQPRAAYGCLRCSARWNGTTTAHCAGCHATFTGPSAFDRHRVLTGEHGRCRDAAALGLVDAGRAYPCWRWPSDDDREHTP